MSDRPDPDVPITKAAFIDVDLPCFFCQYNLRTLDVDGICPECGNPVQGSILHGWLRFASPDWLAKLRTGVTIILWTLLAAVLTYAAFFTYIIVYTRTAPTSSASPPGPLFMWVERWVAIVFGVGFTLAWLVSIWYLTTPEPIREQGLRQSSLATWVRRLHVVFACVNLLLVFTSVGSLFDPYPTFRPAGDPLRILVVLLSILSGCAGAAGFFLLLIHMRRIARRDTRRSLGKVMTFLIWGAVAMVGLLLVCVLLWSFIVRPIVTTVAATTMPVTTAPTSPIAASGPVSPTRTTVYVLPQGNSVVTPPGVTTMPGTLTTMPATTMPAGVPPPMPFGGGFMVFMFAACATQALTLAWFAGGVAALFWFRRVFARAIHQNVADTIVPRG